VADELAVYNLMFDVAGATPSTVTTVDVNLLITGSLSSSDDSSEDSVLTSFLGLEVGWNGAASPSFESGTSPNSNWTIGCFTTSCVSLQYAYTFTGPTGDFGLLDLENNAFQCMGGDACSESYNEAISLTLPSGVTYTSDSPTFLTASSAPEPGTLSLFALGGIAALIAMRLRLLGRRITV
jgi:hypothetical protein